MHAVKLQLCIIFFFGWNKKQGIVQGEGCCTAGFPTLDQLLSANDTVTAPPSFLVVVNNQFSQAQQGIFPSLRITCEGNLTQFIYRTSLGGSQQPLNEYFDIWRNDSNNTDFANITVFVRRDDEVNIMDVNDDVTLYSLDVNIPVQAGDFVGYASFGVTTRLRFQRLEENSGLFRIPANALDLERELPNHVNFPLITAVISPSSVTCLESSIAIATPLMTTPLAPQPTISVTPTSTTQSSSNFTLILIVTLGGGGGALLLMPLVVICVGCVVHKRKRKSHHTNDVTHHVPMSHSNLRKPMSDGDDSSLESNAAYIGHTEYQRYAGVEHYKHQLTPDYQETAFYSEVQPPTTEAAEKIAKNEQDTLPGQDLDVNGDVFEESSSEVFYSEPVVLPGILTRPNIAYHTSQAVQ